ENKMEKIGFDSIAALVFMVSASATAGEGLHFERTATYSSWRYTETYSTSKPRQLKRIKDSGYHLDSCFQKMGEFETLLGLPESEKALADVKAITGSPVISAQATLLNTPISGSLEYSGEMKDFVFKEREYNLCLSAIVKAHRWRDDSKIIVCEPVGKAKYADS